MFPATVPPFSTTSRPVASSVSTMDTGSTVKDTTDGRNSSGNDAGS
jgi:hypothetical protein